MSCADSTHSRISEQKFWLCATISAFLHVLVAVIIVQTMISTYEQIKPLETYLVTYPSHLDSLPNQSMVSAQSRHETQQVQHTASAIQPAPAAPAVTAIPVNIESMDGAHIKEAPVARNPVYQASKTGDSKADSLTVQAPSPSWKNAGISSLPVASGANETQVDMTLGEPGAPQFIHRELPVYPFLARRLDKEGKVVVRLTLDESGRQKNIEVIEPCGFGFTDAAVTALKKSVFSPARKNGKAIASRVLVPVRFVLNGD